MWIAALSIDARFVEWLDPALQQLVVVAVLVRALLRGEHRVARVELLATIRVREAIDHRLRPLIGFARIGDRLFDLRRDARDVRGDRRRHLRLRFGDHTIDRAGDGRCALRAVALTRGKYDDDKEQIPHTQRFAHSALSVRHGNSPRRASLAVRRQADARCAMAELTSGRARRLLRLQACPRSCPSFA